MSLDDLLVETVKGVAGLLDDGDSQLLAHGHDVAVTDLAEGFGVLLEREVVRAPVPDKGRKEISRI